MSSQSVLRKGFFDRPQKKAVERQEPPIITEDLHPFAIPPPQQEEESSPSEEEEADDPFKSFEESRQDWPSDYGEEYEDTVSECSEAAEPASIDTVVQMNELCKQPVDASVPVNAVPKDQEAELQWKPLDMYEVD